MGTTCFSRWTGPTAALLIAAALMASFPGVQSQGDDLTYHIPEELPPGRFIANISRDANISREVGSAELSSLQYRLLLQTPSTVRPLFSVDLDSGVLRVNNTPDRELVCEYSVTCGFQVRIAIQSTVHQFFRTLQIRIYVDDINDNDPTFAKPVISLPISESVSIGTSFIIEGATDLDTGPNNSVVLYDLVPRSDTFGLKVIPKFDGGSRISLVVNAPLDREEVEFYRLGVVAWDGGSPARSGHLTINVTVTDVNDVTPEFAQRIYNVSVNETLTRGDEILRLVARDADAGKNGDVRYRLAPRQTDSIVASFNVNDVTGSLTAATALTSLQGKSVRVIVEAYDMGDEPRVSQAIVYVNILDSVNNPPVLTLSILSGGSRSEIREDVGPGHVVAHLTVNDADADENGLVRCTLRNAYFQLRQLKEKEYKIIVTGSLDRERQAEHGVRVTCQDSGSPPLQAEAAFVVELRDVNDNGPVFVGGNTYVLNVTENNNIKVPLLLLTALDIDSGANGFVTYQIVTPEALEWVQINATGVVTSVKPFDFETIHGLNFTVLAADGGERPLSAEARVRVTVFDLNDNPPKFVHDIFVLELEENQPDNVIVGHVEADDPDLGSGGRVTYQLMPPPNVTLNFTVSLQGLVRATSSFDREAGARHEFDVVARDQGVPQRMSIARVLVNIGDLNDNPPVILYPNPENNSASIPVAVAAGTEVLRVQARDPDVGYNSLLRYELHVQQKSRRRRSADRLFRVDGAGVVRAGRAIHSGDIGQHSCLLIVKDSGNPEFSAESRFTIDVVPGNATAALGDSESVRHAYIVIILLCVTAVIAAIVVAIIIRFRRADRRKKGGVATGVKKMDRMVESPVRRPVPESDGGSVKEDKTAAMIFQADRDRGEQREGPKDTLIMFKMQLAQDYNASDNNSMIHESPRSTTSFGKGLVGERGGDRPAAQGEGEGSDPHTTRLAALRVQQTLMQRSTRPPPLNRALGPERHSTCSERCPDDVVSDSSGETAATDSGRGCSEGDSQSQERDSLQSHTDDCSLRGGLASRSGARSAPPMEKGKDANPRPRSCVVPVYPRIRDPRAGAHHNPHPGGPNRTLSVCTPGGRYTCGQLYPYPPYTQPARRSAGWGGDARCKTDPRGGPVGSMDLCPPHGALFGKAGLCPPEGLVFTHGGSVPMEVLNDSYDDDNTTTTSGSYTIDPDDYQGEIIGYPPNDIYV